MGYYRQNPEEQKDILYEQVVGILSEMQFPSMWSCFKVGTYLYRNTLAVYIVMHYRNMDFDLTRITKEMVMQYIVERHIGLYKTSPKCQWCPQYMKLREEIEATRERIKGEER